LVIEALKIEKITCRKRFFRTCGQYNPYDIQ